MQDDEQQRLFDQWLKSHQGLFFKVVRVYAFTPQDQEDLFQEIVTQVWRSIPSFRGESGVTTWLYRVALNAAIAWTRKEWKHRDGKQSVEGVEPAILHASSAVDPQIDWLYAQIRQLNEIDRSLTLLLLDGFSYKEMAAMLGITENYVGVKIGRIKAHLIGKSKRNFAMEFEELQSIWDTQNDRPVFSMNDSRLAIGLYQQRERSRRRLFRGWFAPFYAGSLLIGVFSVCVFWALFYKTLYKIRLTDPQMSIWDGVALMAAIGAAVAVVAPAYLERRKHERTQNVFAPSLREELERGISQLDFKASFHGRLRVRKVMVLFFFGITVCMWETGRLNGDATPWMILTFPLLSFPLIWYSAALEQKNVELLMRRKRALESMLAALEETK